MQFVLTGFTQDLGCRVFAFEGLRWTASGRHLRCVRISR